jgi:hypothetical protein
VSTDSVIVEQEPREKKPAGKPTDDEDQKLWLQYRETHDQKIKDTLIMKYASLVKYVAGRIAINLPANVEFDDLVSYGILGLIDAIDKYDPERKVKFKTYAKTRIREPFSTSSGCSIGPLGRSGKKLGNSRKRMPSLKGNSVGAQLTRKSPNI